MPEHEIGRTPAENENVLHALGMIIAEADKKRRDWNGLAAPGVVVLGARFGCAATKSGIESGDVISMVDGEPITSLSDLSKALADRDPGKPVTMLVWCHRISQFMLLRLSEDSSQVSQQALFGEPELAGRSSTT
ncbi:MAG: PDZ domain-containing protein [Geobacter sp.]|nr:PDZ domain-containing protein [Geobacter sp.]